MKAYRVIVKDGFPDGITMAEKASQARYTAFAGAKDAGYSLEFKDIRIIRAPEYDGSNIQPGRVITVDYLEGE